MQSLTHECRAHVLQYLSLTEIEVARLVSKQLRAAADSNALWCLLCREHGLNVTPSGRFASWKDFTRSFMVSHAELPRGRGRFLPLLTQGPDDTRLEVVEATMDVARPFDVVQPRGAAVVGFVLTDNSAATAHHLRRFLCHATGCNALSAAADACSWEAPDTRGIHTWDLFPYASARKARTTCLALNGCGVDALRSSTDAEDDIALATKLFQTLLHACSTVHVLGASAQQWLSVVGPAVPTVRRDTASAFNTPENLPDVYIAEPCDLASLSPSLKSWFLYRCNEVATLPRDAPSTATTLKPYRIPGYVSHLATATVSCAGALRICVAAGTSAVGAPWYDTNLQSDLLLAQRNHFHRFYTGAMETELSDRGQPMRTDEDEGSCTPLLPVPVASANLANMHDHYFFAALRMFAIHVGAFCGANTAAGLAVLELLKRDINTSFRRLWRQNQRTSLEYCTDVFAKVFDPVMARFVERNEMAATPKGLRQWYTTMDDKIHEYSMKAKGPRRCDVLWEQLSHTVLPAVVEYAKTVAPGTTYLHVEDVETACRGLTAEAQEMLTQFRADQDKILGGMQRSSAVFTSQIGIEWETAILSNSVGAMRDMCLRANVWESDLQRKLLALGATVEEDCHLCCYTERIEAIDAALEAERARREHGRAVAARQPDAYSTRPNCVVPHRNGWEANSAVSQLFAAAAKAFDVSAW